MISALAGGRQRYEKVTVRFGAPSGTASVTVTSKDPLPAYVRLYPPSPAFVLDANEDRTFNVILDPSALPPETEMPRHLAATLVVDAGTVTGSPKEVEVKVEVEPSHVVMECGAAPGRGAPVGASALLLACLAVGLSMRPRWYLTAENAETAERD